ncbi:MAG: DUF6463 family protein [Pleurocapsa sp. MO_192.B19]|nr:DUF6463 family protein [Pleurocapsa sp. MO_192.B19]
MLRLAGWWWIVVSAIHPLVVIIQYFDQWKAIAQDGWFNVIAPNPFAPIFEREDAFWCMFLTPFLLLIGKLCLWAYRRQLVFPLSVGVILTGTMLVGLFLEPLSGIWFALPPSLMLLWSSKPKSGIILFKLIPRIK